MTEIGIGVTAGLIVTGVLLMGFEAKFRNDGTKKNFMTWVGPFLAFSSMGYVAWISWDQVKDFIFVIIQMFVAGIGAVIGLIASGFNSIIIAMVICTLMICSAICNNKN